TTGAAPTSLVDVGGGTGAGMWAARAVWPSLEQVTVVDRSEAATEVGKRLARELDVPVAWQVQAATDELPSADVAVWPVYRQALSFSAQEQAKLTRMLALHLATSSYPEAKAWLQQALAEQQDDSLHEWLVRVALRKGDWAGVQEAIDGMPEELRNT